MRIVYNSQNPDLSKERPHAILVGVNPDSPRNSLLRRAAGTILRSQQIGLVAVLVALGIALTMAAGSHVDPLSGSRVNNFLNAYTLVQMGTDASSFAIMGVGATIVIIAGGIDLSVGAI